MLYQNISGTTKTFYHIVFHPGEIHDVPGYINDVDFKQVKKLKAANNGASMSNNLPSSTDTKNKVKTQEVTNKDGSNSSK